MKEQMSKAVLREEAGEGATEEVTGNRVQEHFATCHPHLSQINVFLIECFPTRKSAFSFLAKKSFICPTLN